MICWWPICIKISHCWHFLWFYAFAGLWIWCLICKICSFNPFSYWDDILYFGEFHILKSFKMFRLLFMLMLCMPLSYYVCHYLCICIKICCCYLKNSNHFHNCSTIPCSNGFMSHIMHNVDSFPLNAVKVINLNEIFIRINFFTSAITWCLFQYSFMLY